MMKILQLAEKCIQGLSIENVSKAMNVSRVTATKDLEVLVTAGKLKVREIGKTKLHSLPKYFKEIKFSIIFLIFKISGNKIKRIMKLEVC